MNNEEDVNAPMPLESPGWTVKGLEPAGLAPAGIMSEGLKIWGGLTHGKDKNKTVSSSSAVFIVGL